ncbi:hypothetical protein ABZ369_19950, partial [Streptomyces sp. NPDC005918]
MASSPMASSTQSPRPNLAFRRLRGQRSPGEFAAAVRRAAREIGERVCCDARYIGRVEAGEIRCPNYAYERVFLHMFPGRTLTDLGFAPRALVRGRGVRAESPSAPPVAPVPPTPPTPVPATTIHLYESHPTGSDPRACDPYAVQTHEESDVQRRAFMTGSTATVVAALGPIGLTLGGPAEAAALRGRRVGDAEARAVE